MRSLIAALMAGTVSMLTPISAIAATIEKTSGRSGSFVVTVTGELALGDEVRFVAIAGTLSHAVVVFDSPGGNLFSGIEIGKVIRFNHFDTLVPNGRTCASACALAWLGGESRLIGATGRVGFHAPYNRSSSVISASPAGTQAVKNYVEELGLSAAAARYITETPPDKLQWLGFFEAKNVGIEVLRAGAPP